MNFSKLAVHQREIVTLLVLVSVTTPLFWLTDLDLTVAALFYRSDGQDTVWPFKDWWLWSLLYDYGDYFAMLAALMSLFVVLSSFVRPRFIPLRRAALYVFLVIILGPGLLVNLVFKDNWGRPRPIHIEEFGGTYAYVPPLKIAQTDDKSFPCGHCSVAYMFFAFYFLSKKRRLIYLWGTIGLAILMALARMSAGGHFCSDTLWSGYVVFLVAWGLYYGWYNRVNI